FTRLYAPEVTMGIQTTEELADIGPEGNGRATRPIFDPGSAKSNSALTPQPEPQHESPLASPPGGTSADWKRSEATAVDSAATHAAAAPSASGSSAESPTGQYNYLKAVS